MSKTNINKCILTTYSPDKDGYFEVEFDMWSSQSWTDCGTEYDCGVNWEIIKESESCISTQ